MAESSAVKLSELPHATTIGSDAIFVVAQTDGGEMKTFRIARDILINLLKGSKGDAGPQGLQGPAGMKGEKGNDGLSSYQVWLNAGHTGSVADYLLSLKGNDGTGLIVKGVATDATLPAASPGNLGHIYTIRDNASSRDGQMLGSDGNAWISFGAIVGAPGPAGTSIIPKGLIGSINDLPASAPANIGHFYIVGNDNDVNFGNGYISNGTKWVSMGRIVGPQGPELQLVASGDYTNVSTNWPNDFSAPNAYRKVGNKHLWKCTLTMNGVTVEYGKAPAIQVLLENVLTNPDGSPVPYTLNWKLNFVEGGTSTVSAFLSFECADLTTLQRMSLDTGSESLCFFMDKGPGIMLNCSGCKPLPGQLP